MSDLAIGFSIWVFSAFVLFITSLAIIAYDKKHRTLLVTVGVFSLILDYIFETSGILQGGWGYDYSILFIGVVPIELMMLFFSVGVLSVYLVWKLSQSKYMQKDLWGLVEFLLIGIGTILMILFLFNIKPVGMIHVVIPLGIWGIMVSNRKQVVLLVASIIFVFDLVTETLFTMTGVYHYADKFNLSIALIYFFIVMFAGGLVTHQSWCSKGSSICVVGNNGK